jgi:hypothetical protein
MTISARSCAASTLRSVFSLPRLAALGTAVLPCWASTLEAADNMPPAAAPFLALSAADPLARPNGIVVFGGPMSTRAFGSTMRFDTDFPIGPNYDNFFIGAAYDRDWWRLGYGFTAGFEIGVGDRFGHYALCCTTVIKSNSILNSPELWAGPRISFDGIVVANTLRIAGALTFGFSVAGNSIGREREAEISWNGNARFLGYLGPELSFSLVDFPEWDLVYRVQHRSGADGIFGNIREGYNANTLGLRYRF